ncbi:MAG: methyltransferase domain-containing protein [Acidobacteriia bacterium]|nr:methyltransferase domain-containing protein [Terriglobia bacterium]
MDAITQYTELMDQERAENDIRHAKADARAPLPFLPVDHRDKMLWDQLVGPLAGKQVLDVGCGDGLKTVWLASQDAMVFAVDVSPVGVAKTLERARFHGLQERVRAYCADACQLDTMMTPNSIDIALGFGVLHHLPPREFGQSLKAVLKPGGHAVFFENSNANPLYQLARRIRNDETAAGTPLTGEEAQMLIREVGTGAQIFPRFCLFGLVKKYVFRNSRLFAWLLDILDDAIDAVPGARQWSAYMWVEVHKPVE